jgi:hypothetical protein
VTAGTKPQTAEQQGGVTILSKATVAAANTSGSLRALIRNDKLIDRVRVDQPTTHTQTVTSEGAETAIMGAKAGERPNMVALRLRGPALSTEASSAVHSLTTASRVRLQFPGPIVPIAEVANTAIPPAAERPIRHAIAESGLLNTNLTFDPSPAFSQAEAAAPIPTVPTAPPAAQ